MSTFAGTPGNDRINGPLDAPGAPVDAAGGDDHVTLGAGQLFISGPGADTVVGGGSGGYALWPAPAAGLVDLAQGYALDGFGFKDTLSGISVVHGNAHGLTVVGTPAREDVLVFGGKNDINLAGGADTVKYWDLNSADYDIAAKPDRVEVTHKATGITDTLRGVETLEFWSANTLEKRIDLLELQQRAAPNGFSIQPGPVINNADANYNPRWVIGHLNVDGRPDLALRFDPISAFAVGKIGQSPIRFYLGNAAGGYDAASLSASDNVAPTMVSRILTADFNADGLSDIVIGASGQDPYADGKPVGPWPGELTYLLMSGPNGHQSVSVPGMPSIFSHHVSVGDINADGHLDIFNNSIGFGSASDFKSPFSYFLMGDGKGQFQVNRTRLPDLIANANVITLVPQTNGKTVFDSNTYTSSALIDANQDGALDLCVLPMGNTQRGIIFLNDGRGQFSDQRKIVLPAGPFGAGSTTGYADGRYETAGTIYLDTKVIDVNGDGRSDLVSVVTKDNRIGSNFEFYKGAAVQVLINTANGFVDESAARVDFVHAPASSYSHYDSIEATDFNADGLTDLLLYRGFNNTDGASHTRILLNDGWGRFKDTPYPAGIPKGLLIAVEPADGKYALITDAGRSVDNGVESFLIRVDGAQFDAAKGLDLFSGQPRSGGALRADVAGRWLHGSNQADQLTLLSGNERAFGYGGNDTLTGGGGNDLLHGGEGIDTALYNGKRSDYALSKRADGLWQAGGPTARDGQDLLQSIERMRFSDVSLALDVVGRAGDAAKVVGAALGRAGLANLPIVGVVLAYMDAGGTANSGADLLVQSGVMASLAGGADAQSLQRFVLGNLGLADGTPASGRLSAVLQQDGPMAFFKAAVNAPENAVNIDLVGLAQAGLPYVQP